MNSSNGRILKNTGLLYFRLIFLTVINLYAVRITLLALGVVDYGIFNVIASVVASLSLLTGAMTSASQRFLSFHLGKEDYDRYSHTFTLLLICFFAIAGICVAIGEILGYFFIEKWLSIPADRLSASYWVFQTSLFAFAFGFVTIPYSSSIVANERMDAFALFSIVEGMMKLGAAYLLMVYRGDRLILYSVLTASISIVIFLMSMLYCHSKFRYCRYVWKWDKSIFAELSNYTGWNLLGSISGILATQGQNILLNIYFGPIINVAKAIADKIQNAIYGFSINLLMAVSPQIIKSYASEDYSRAMNLSVKMSKMSFLMTFILAFPVVCNMDDLLKLWLGVDSKVEDMVAFSKMILIYSMLQAMEPPISRLIQATGNIKRYQIYVGIVTISYLPIAWLSLLLGGSAIMTLVILIGIVIVSQVVRIIVAHNQVGLQYRVYMINVVYPIIKVIIIGFAVYMPFEYMTTHTDMQIILLRIFISAFIGIFIAAIFGLNRYDRKMILNLLFKKFI